MCCHKVSILSFSLTPLKDGNDWGLQFLPLTFSSFVLLITKKRVVCIL
jgi:hypothetical protein